MRFPTAGVKSKITGKIMLELDVAFFINCCVYFVYTSCTVSMKFMSCHSCSILSENILLMCKKAV